MYISQETPQQTHHRLLEVENAALIRFVQQQAASCKHILSVFTGAFILQAAGFLQGKRATTHWQLLSRLRAYPEVTVVEQRFVRDGNIWTATGISAGIDLALAFIADQAGEDVAGRIQLAAEYYPHTITYDGLKHNTSESSVNRLV